MRVAHLLKHSALTLSVVVMLASVQAVAGTLTLKEEAFVRGPYVLLGEVADIEGPNAKALSRIEVTLAALPGSSKRLDAALVESQLRRAGVSTEDWKIQGNRYVMATTLHLDLTQEMIAEDLRQFVARHMPWDPMDTVIEVSAPPRTFTVPDGVLDIRWRPNPQYTYLGLGTFRGEISVDGQVARIVLGKATVRTYEDVIVASRGIARNETLSASNMRLEQRELSTRYSDIFFSMDDLRGYVAKSSIYEGQVITGSRLARAKIIKRNQIVNVETSIGSLTVRTVAKTTMDAAIGDRVTCKTLESKELFVGVLRADGVVVVD